ncbi:hypothetical protein NPIL_165011 [Nephila pilipes]|uniref:Uncharacterized protein n=1 Tax=Nephila pilipes TaxID=299642 RepID=A0A8X6NUH7_NEPPI|nr:hypothetical protein NPIL_165011 [Nephila pilipes]
MGNSCGSLSFVCPSPCTRESGTVTAPGMSFECRWPQSTDPTTIKKKVCRKWTNGTGPPRPSQGLRRSKGVLRNFNRALPVFQQKFFSSLIFDQTHRR